MMASTVGGTPERALRIAFATNVPEPVLEPYLSPLASRPEVGEIVLIRDRKDVTVRPKCRVVTPPAWWPRSLVTKLAARRWLFWWVGRTRRPDVVMIMHWFPDGPAVARWAGRLGVPLVTNIIGGKAELLDGGRRWALSSLPRAAKGVMQAYQRWWLKKSMVITVTGEATRCSLLKAGLHGPALLVLHAAIEPGPASASSDNRDIDVAFIGRVDADKRIDRFFEVIMKVAVERPELTVSVVGARDPDVAHLPAYQLARRTLGERLSLLGRVPDVPAILSRAKLLLITSDSEGRTLAGLEALICGAAVVATAVGDLEEAISASGGGVTIPLLPDEHRVVFGLAEVVLRLLSTEADRKRMAARGREFVLRMHSTSQADRDWQEILRLVGPQR